MESIGNYVYVPDDFYLNPTMFSVPTRYEHCLETLLVTRGDIKERTKKLAEDILNDFNNNQIVFLCVLRGAFMFFKELLDFINKKGKGAHSDEAEFVRAKSYHLDKQGDVFVEGLGGLDLEGKNVVIVEDLVDSGKTLHTLKEKILEMRPGRLKICVLVYKRNTKNSFILPDFIGFSIPDKWIVGCNMDYNGYFRDLKHIGVINDEGKERFK